jgi:hypothetical protein
MLFGYTFIYDSLAPDPLNEIKNPVSSHYFLPDGLFRM